MSSLPHPVPSRMAHNVAVLFGHEDDTLIAWQRACVQAAEALRPQHDPERLTKALALAQGGHVALDDDGYAIVTSGAKRYQVQAEGICDCPDYQHRGTPCKHVLAVLIHTKAQTLAAPRPSPAPAASAPAKPTRPPKPRHSAAWDVHESPVSSCFKIRLGAFEWTHTMRATDDAELHTRVQAFVPTFREIVAALDALQAERDATKAAPAVPAQPPAAPATRPQTDLQALVQQAVQQALAAANGQATPPPQAPPANGPAQAAPPPEGWCALHQVQMELRSNERGSWWSHRLADGSYCKGK
jgi:SWIM zinc finger